MRITAVTASTAIVAGVFRDDRLSGGRSGKDGFRAGADRGFQEIDRRLGCGCGGPDYRTKRIHVARYEAESAWSDCGSRGDCDATTGVRRKKRRPR